jgi:hypothetical protein
MGEGRYCAPALGLAPARERKSAGAKVRFVSLEMPK